MKQRRSSSYSSSSEFSDSESDTSSSRGHHSKKEKKHSLQRSGEGWDILNQLKVLLSKNSQEEKHGMWHRRPFQWKLKLEPRKENFEEPGNQELGQSNRSMKRENSYRSSGIADSDGEESDELLTGTEIPRKAFENAMAVLHRLLGFEIPVSLNKTNKAPLATMPVDVE